MKTRISLLPTLLVITLPALAQNTSSIAFDGVDDLIDCTTSSMFELTGALTLEAWVKVDPVQSNSFGRIIDKFNHIDDEGFNLIVNGGHLFMEIRDPATNGYSVFGSSIDDGTWHHVAGSFSGTELRIYIDGVLDDQYSFAATTIQPCDNPLSIGNGWDGNVFLPLHAAIDEVRIWDIVRTDAEILACMDSHLAGNEPGLLGYWRFNENTGTMTSDLTGFGNDGTLTNGPLWSTDVMYPSPGICTISAINDDFELSAITLSPNPLESDGSLLIKGLPSGPCTIAIHDASGRVERTMSVAGAGNILVERGNLSPGVYMVSVTTSNGRAMSTRLVAL